MRLLSFIGPIGPIGPIFVMNGAIIPNTVFSVSLTMQNKSPSPRREPGSWRVTLLLVALVATAVVTPMFFLGNASGHHFQPHIASWMGATGHCREGILFPRWAGRPNSRFDHPRFIFSPPHSL